MLRDPSSPSLAVFAGLVLAGFVAIGLGARVASRTSTVAFQVPADVSGALGGVVLIAIGCALAVVQVGRRLAAAERDETEDLLDEVHRLLVETRPPSEDRP